MLATFSSATRDLQQRIQGFPVPYYMVPFPFIARSLLYIPYILRIYIYIFQYVYCICMHTSNRYIYIYMYMNGVVPPVGTMVGTSIYGKHSRVVGLRPRFSCV